MTLNDKSWKTTTVAITSILVAIGVFVIEPLLDNDPTTIPKWQECISAVIAGAVGLWARDNDKSSEEVGAN